MPDSSSDPAAEGRVRRIMIDAQAMLGILRGVPLGMVRTTNLPADTRAVAVRPSAVPYWPDHHIELIVASAAFDPVPAGDVVSDHALLLTVLRPDNPYRDAAILLADLASWVEGEGGSPALWYRAHQGALLDAVDPVHAAVGDEEVVDLAGDLVAAWERNVTARREERADG